MITYKQVTKSEDIAALEDYYVLDLRTTGPDPVSNAVSSVSLLQVCEDEIVKEAVVRISSDADSEDSAESGYYTEIQVANSMARLLIDQVVIAEPLALQFLRILLERYGHEGTIRFVPVGKLTCTLYPSLSPADIQDLARQMEIPEQDNAGLLRIAFFENELFRRCRISLGADLSASSSSEEDVVRQRKRRLYVSNKTLNRWSKAIWSVSPWLITGVVFLVVLFFINRLPRNQNSAVDRNIAPNHYLVLSWNQLGKYGTQPKSRGGETQPVEFRVPYGVYNVLNNNSIPVELTIVTEGHEAKAESSDDASESQPTETAAELSVKASAGSEQEEEEDLGPSTIIMRPNSTRQIIIDTDQYLTLSEDALDLILFYVSEVPEEKESNTTGQDNSSGRVVYAYVKGTEVRFRKSPSLEGIVIDSMQNGQQVQVLGVTGEWTHVAVQNEKGYIFSQYLTSEDPQAAAYAAKMAEEAANSTDSGDAAVASVDESGDSTGSDAQTAADQPAPAEPSDSDSQPQQ